MRTRRYKRRLWLWAAMGTVLVALISFTAVMWLARRNSAPQASVRSESMRLPFPLPCALASRDADGFYSALARSDRRAVTAMLGDNRVVMVRKGVSFSVTSFGQTSALFVKGNSSHVQVCYVPSEIVRKIEAKLTKR